MAETVQVESKTSSIIRSAKNLPSNMAHNVEIGSRVMEMMIKQLKIHLARSLMDLQSILSPYIPKKNKFLLIVLAIVKALS